MEKRACLDFLGFLEKMACLGRLAFQVYQVPRVPPVTSLVQKMVLQGSKACRDCQGTEDFLETLAFQDPRVTLFSPTYLTIYRKSYSNWYTCMNTCMGLG